MPNLSLLTEQQGFTEHSGISAIDSCWLEQHFKPLRMSDAKCTIINRRRSRNGDKCRVSGKALENNQV
jgi:hypothetical protein